ncbi:hypothetical protein JKP88DRAFT_278428 [Tribonema minus]|uniref:dolichol kinase n=1 Tax=Tribonema minus TaxID=303371 RepID=A0A835YV32_9STRA|nr:hypothetical protein JKP88DRAFT_278428 [Tribonema minus]
MACLMLRRLSTDNQTSTATGGDAPYCRALLQCAVLSALATTFLSLDVAAPPRAASPLPRRAALAVAALSTIAMAHTYPLLSLAAAAAAALGLSAAGTGGRRAAGGGVVDGAEAAVLAVAAALWLCDAALVLLGRGAEGTARGAVTWSPTATLGPYAIAPLPHERSEVGMVAQAGVLGVLLTACAMAAVRTEGTAGVVRAWAVCAACISTVLCLWLPPLLGGANPLVWARAPPNPLLITCWLAALLLGLPSIPALAALYRFRRTVSRKLFHLLLVAIVVPGLMLSAAFTALAGAVATALMVAVEAVRVMRLPPLARALHGYYGTFLAERDQGLLVLTPLYLVAGVCLPLLLCASDAAAAAAAADEAVEQGGGLSRSCGWALPQLCGLIALGVGDAAAALVGSAVGRHKWPGSQHTLEGSAAMLVATFASLMAAASWLGPAGADGAPPAVLKYLAASVLITLMEAWTTQSTKP